MFSGGPICHHKCLLEVDVEMTQDVTVKKDVDVLSFRPVRTASGNRVHNGMNELFFNIILLVQINKD